MGAALKQKIIALFSSVSLRQAALLFTARSANSFMALLFSLLAGRLLTVEDHGVYSQLLARIVVVQALAEIGLQYSLVRFLSPAIEQGRMGRVALIFRASLQLKFYAIGGLALAVLFAILTMVSATRLVALGLPAELLAFARPERVLHFWVIFLGGAGMSVISYLDAILAAHQWFFRLSLWLPSIGLIRLSLLAFFVWTPGVAIRAEHVVFAFALGPYLAMVLFFFVFPADFFFTRVSGRRYGPWMRRLFYFNLWIVAASFMSIVSDWMEVLLLTQARQTGLFNAARIPMQGFLILLATMQSLLLPRLARLKTPAEFAAFFRRVYRLLLPASLVFVPGFWIFSWFIPAWYGAEYLPSVRVFQILYPNFVLRLFFAPLGVALFALDQPRLIAVEAGLRMFSGLLFNLLLIPAAGIVGAAVASFLSQVVGWGFLVFCYTKYFKTGRFPGAGEGSSG